MNAQELMNLRELLIDRRREIYDRVRRLEGRWRDLSEREIELEEEAQKASITEPYDQLDNNGKDQIEQIDLALSKMLLGEYGVCEACGDHINLKRLHALPWTRLCVECARDYEKNQKKLPPPSDIIAAARIPDDLAELTNDQLIRSIHEQVRRDNRIDTEELDISIQNGVVFLDGTLPSEREHEILLQTLTDIMGFSDIVDRLEVNKLMWEREDRAPGINSEKITLEDRLIYDREYMTEDLFEAGDEIPYTPPDAPFPVQEQ